MSVASRRASVSVLLCLISPISISNAFEATGSAVSDQMLEIFEASGIKDLTYQTVSGSGGNVGISGISGSVVDSGEDFVLKIGSLGITGGNLADDKTLTMNGLDLSGFSITSKETALTADSLNSTGLKFPSVETMKARGPVYRSTNVYESTIVTGFALSTHDGLYLPISEIRISNSNFLDNLPRSTKMSISNVALSANNLPGGGAQSYLTELGYENIRFDVSMESSWDDATGILDVARFQVTGTEFADMMLSLNLGGWTPELFASVTNLDPNDQEQGQELLGKLQSTTINNITLELDNKSIVDRVLDQQSKKAGVDRGEFVKKTISSLAVPLTFLKNPNFQQMVTTQLRAFLSQPNSISVRVSPGKFNSFGPNFRRRNDCTTNVTGCSWNSNRDCKLD